MNELESTFPFEEVSTRHCAFPRHLRQAELERPLPHTGGTLGWWSRCRVPLAPVVLDRDLEKDGTMGSPHPMLFWGSLGQDIKRHRISDVLLRSSPVIISDVPLPKQERPSSIPWLPFSYLGDGTSLEIAAPIRRPLTAAAYSPNTHTARRRLDSHR